MYKLHICIYTYLDFDNNKISDLMIFDVISKIETFIYKQIEKHLKFLNIICTYKNMCIYDDENVI